MFPAYFKDPGPTILGNDAAYADHPWAQLTVKERQFYDPALRFMYKARSAYTPFVQFRQNLTARNARFMTVTEMFDPHPNFDQIGFREMWSRPIYTDTRQRTITFSRYGGSASYHKFDWMVTYFNQLNTLEGYRQLTQSMIARQIVDVLDMLARNALIQMPLPLYASGTSFNDLSVNDKMSTDMLDHVNLQMRMRKVPYVTGSTLPGDYNPGRIVCLTTPGVIHDLQQQSDPQAWLSRMAYAKPDALINYGEFGEFRNIRFVESPHNILWNAGKIETQCLVSSAIKEGDGSPTTPVDEVYTVGQPGATHYLQLGTLDASGATVDAAYMAAKFAVNQYVTVHAKRTNDFGITNGVDYREGKAHTRRIISIDTANRRLAFDQPIFEAFDADLGGGTFAYVTRGMHIHVSLFIGGSDGVTIGVGQPPRLYVRQPIDNYLSVWTVSWDAFLGYQPWNPYVVTPFFTAGIVSNIGATPAQL